MLQPVHSIETTSTWWAFGDYHPRGMLMTRCDGYECVEGLMVDDGPRPAGTARKESLPFRFYIPYGQTYEQAGLSVWHLVETHQSLMDRVI